MTLKTKFGLFFFVALFFVILLSIGKNVFLSDDTLYIAIAGPMKKSKGEAMLQGAQLYLDHVNRQGGIAGQQVKLLQFDDENEANKAKERALEIVNSDALAVIGHYTSGSSLAAAPIYQQQGIAAITGSATANEITENNDWYFRVIFNNSDQGALLAHYTHKVLDHKKAYVLFDEDPYGKTLAATFIQAAKGMQLKIEHQWSFNDSTSFDKQLTKMVNILEREDEYGMLFLATHSTEAIKVITRLRYLERKVPMIGADALASSHFIQTFKEQYPQEKNYPGYYTDGIYLASPFLIDIAGKRAQDFQREFFDKKYPKESIATSAMYYDAAMVAVEAIKKTLEKGKAKGKTISLKEKREAVKDSLWQLSNISNAVEGVTGDIYFDKNGDAIKSIPIGIYKSGIGLVASEQYQPLSYLQNIDNLLQKVLDNEIIHFKGKFMSRAQVVYVGIDFNDVSELNAGSSTFTADFYLWFRFKSQFNDKNINFVNIYDPDDSNLLTQVLEQESSIEQGVTTKTYRIKTQFKVDLDFRDYPLDKQVLPIYFRHNTLTRNNLIYVPDLRGMNLSQNEAQGANSSETKKFFSVGGWKVNHMSFFQNTKTNDSTLGLLELVGAQQRIEYSQFNATVEIERHVFNFILKNLLPTLFIVMLGYLAFFIGDYKTAVGIGVNMIVASSLFHLKMSSEMPKIDYIFLMEYFFYMIYFLAIFIIVVELSLGLKGSEKTEGSQLWIARIKRFSRIFYPIIIIIFVSIIFIFKS
ncbi:MAG: hypothetical protein DRQ49_12200 [Gammaproteobacteria bacterium]|nr:MAG: hypothetical protein DRQ49_12200 [Gammaproteobacteria bacterium]